MIDMPLTPSGSTPAEQSQPLLERVRARVAEVARTLDGRARASRPKTARPRRPRAAAALHPATGQTPEMTREARSLRRVFHELGDTHRRYRRETGQRVSPALRDAARAFKQAPTLTSLVGVAAFLDEEGILAW